MREAFPKLASDFIADLLKEWLFEEESQDLLEKGFVSWGIGEDVARNMAEQAVESLQQNFGTMLLMTGGFSGIGAVRTGLSRKHTDQELYDAMHHRAQLVGSLHQRTELREKLRKGEEIDQREMKRLERDIDYQRRVLSTFHRAFNKAGGMEDAESAFQRMGLDPRQSFQMCIRDRAYDDGKPLDIFATGRERMPYKGQSYVRSDGTIVSQKDSKGIELDAKAVVAVLQYVTDYHRTNPGPDPKTGMAKTTRDIVRDLLMPGPNQPVEVHNSLRFKTQQNAARWTRDLHDLQSRYVLQQMENVDRQYGFAQ